MVEGMLKTDTNQKCTLQKTCGSLLISCSPAVVRDLDSLKQNVKNDLGPTQTLLLCCISFLELACSFRLLEVIRRIFAISGVQKKTPGRIKTTDYI